MSDNQQPAGKDPLVSIIERVERLVDQVDDLKTDIKEVYAEAKGNGYETAAIRKVIKIRRADKLKLQQEQAIVDLYLNVVGEER
jgi:uncharacterized protein (UPF0335 family)